MRVIGGCARGHKLKTRKGMNTRPTADRVKESLFNILAPFLEGCRFMDIFAGNGSIGIEALSRGADYCVFIEKSHQCGKIIKENLIFTGLSYKANLIISEAGAAITRMKKKERFDIIFLDPPYHSTELAVVIEQISMSGLLIQDGLLVVEHNRQDNAWFDNQWTVFRDKIYGDTALTFLTPAAK